MFGKINHRTTRRVPTAAVEPGTLSNEIGIGCPGEPAMLRSSGDAVRDPSE